METCPFLSRKSSTLHPNDVEPIVDVVIARQNNANKAIDRVEPLLSDEMCLSWSRFRCVKLDRPLCFVSSDEVSTESIALDCKIETATSSQVQLLQQPSGGKAIAATHFDGLD